MASPPRPIPGLTRRRQTFFLTIVKPVDLRAGPADRYAFRSTLGTRDEPIARIKALAIRADVETQWAAERERRRPQPAIAPTPALIDALAQAVRHAVLIGDDRLRVEPEGLDAALASYEWEGNPSPTERRLILRAWIAEQWVQMVAAGDLSAITLRIERLTQPMGLRIDWSGMPGKLALLKLARVLAKASAEAVARDRGELIDTPEAPAVPGIQAVPVASPSALSAGLSWATLLADWKAAKTRKPAAIKITERGIAEFIKACGPVPPEDLDRGHAAKYRAALVAQGLKGRSIRNLLSPLVALLNLAVDSGKLKVNPWAGVKVDTSDSTKRLPWRLEQLKALVSANNSRDDPGRWLLPLLLYTGCRLGEIAQLELADLKEIDGQFSIEIHDMATEGHEARSVKTAAGLRVVPIAPQLLAMGLREHAEALRACGERFLFPRFIQSGKKRPSELAGRYFLDLRKDAGIAPDPRFSAHSCRHNVRSVLAGASVNETIIDKLIGHESGAVQSRYTHASMGALVTAVAVLDWSGLNFAKLGA